MTTPAAHRWAQVEAMPAAEYATIQANVSVCMACLGPATLSGVELAHTIAEPVCRRCAGQLALALEEAS